MLQLIGYDLKKPWDYWALESAVKDAGGGINVMNGPWLSGANETPRQVLKTVRKGLKKANRRKDKLLVVPLGMGEIGTGRKDALLNVPKKAKGKKRNAARRAEKEHILAIAYTLRNRKGRFELSRKEQDQHKKAVKTAIGTFKDQCHPVDALWFVNSSKPAHRARLDLEKAAPFLTKDELMVTTVLPIQKGDSRNLRSADVEWLRKHGVLAS